MLMMLGNRQSERVRHGVSDIVRGALRTVNSVIY